MTSGELAARVGVNIQTIRFYERKGLLLPPHRWPDSGHRDYDDDAVKRMRFIHSAKKAGFTLGEIRELLEMELLPGESCDEVRELVETKVADLDRRLKEMRRMRRLLTQMAEACRNRSSDATCPALWELGERRKLRSGSIT